MNFEPNENEYNFEEDCDDILDDDDDCDSNNESEGVEEIQNDIGYGTYSYKNNSESEYVKTTNGEDDFLGSDDENSD